jgi:hypothetical protein
MGRRESQHLKQGTPGKSRDPTTHSPFANAIVAPWKCLPAASDVVLKTRNLPTLHCTLHRPCCCPTLSQAARALPLSLPLLHPLLPNIAVDQAAPGSDQRHPPPSIEPQHLSFVPPCAPSRISVLACSCPDRASLVAQRSLSSTLSTCAGSRLASGTRLRAVNQRPRRCTPTQSCYPYSSLLRSAGPRLKT